MSLSSIVLWWDEWQLRILVLASCFIQYVLFFSIWMRRAHILRRLRVLVWVAYIAGDAVAIYALATLFNRKETSDGESSNLEVLWAPVLLIHLGGQPWINAYSLEDNELWKRHTITLVSQVTVALYVFCKWWSGENNLLAAAILLFLLGILKFSQKPWALRSASFNSLQTSNFMSAQAKGEGHIDSLEEYVQSAKMCVLKIKIHSQHEVATDRIIFMFIDMFTPYSFRIAELRYFLILEYMHTCNVLQLCLGRTFNLLYSRLKSIATIPGICLMMLLPFLALASTVLFTTSHKDGHNEKDIKVTYILFGCTTVLVFLLPCIAFGGVFILWFKSFFMKYTRGWHDMVPQYNLISFCVRKKKPTFLMKLGTFRFLKELINQHWYIQHVPIASQITQVARQHMEDGWKKYIHDAASYKRFSELRGQWALRRHHQLQLGWSLRMPYDESVLIWHVATDICFYHPNTSPQCQQGEATQRSREISNYMFYLLLIRPEMLMPGTRSDLFTLASDIILENSKGSLDMTEENLAQEILKMPTLLSAADMVSKAFKLSKALMELGDEERWTVIQGVWVEMICYSASRCRGYLHAKSLGEGGEFLSFIWLLWSFMGMETLADKNQMSETQEENGEAWTSHPRRALSI